MPLATYTSTWTTNLVNALVFPEGNPAMATAKLSFVQSIVMGITFAFVGSTVSTEDVGTTNGNTGAGAGTPAGLTGFLVPTYSSTFTSLCLSKFQNFTKENSIVMNAIASTFVVALTQTSITTTHPGTTLGTGVAKLTPPTAAQITSSLIANAVPPVNSNPVYSRWSDYCDVIGQAVAAGSTTLVGTVNISGLATPPLISTAPGTKGTGTIG